MSRASLEPPATDRNLLFGVLALHADLIDNQQFAEICGVWSTRKQTPLPDLLIERGWINADDRREVERLLERKLRKRSGDSKMLLATVSDEVRSLLHTLADQDIRKSLDALADQAAGSADSSSVMVNTLCTPTEQRSRYALTRLHAQGGLGRIWIAHDTDLNRQVALKEIKPDQAQNVQAGKRFLQEAQVTGQLEHPYIVPVYELARRPEDNQPFYTMRFVQGETLQEAIARIHGKEGDDEHHLQTRKLLTAFINVCHAISYAHSRGVIHRDLKPANVLLGAFGEVIVLDWGLAKLVNQPPDQEMPGVAVTPDAQGNQTLAGQALGTPAYMAPEQAKGRTDLIDERTDIYGLGTILFEILTGEPPHVGKDTVELLRQIALEPSPLARNRYSRVAPALDAICAKAMARERGDRYASAAELNEDVGSFLADEPVAVYPEPLLARLARWGRRHRYLVTFACGLLLTTSVFLVIGLYVAGQARVLAEKARDRTQELHNQTLKQKENAEEQKKRADNYFKIASLQRKMAMTTLKRFVFEAMINLKDRPEAKDLRDELIHRARSGLLHMVQTVNDFPEDDGSMAMLLCQLGDLFWLLKDMKDAADQYEKAYQMARELSKKTPDDLETRENLAMALDRVGAMYQERNQDDQARQSFTEMLGILNDLVKTHPNDGEVLFFTARANVRMASMDPPDTRSGYFSKAMDFLKKAEAVGYFKDPIFVDELKIDPALDTIRPNPAFKTWMDGVVASSKTRKL